MIRFDRCQLTTNTPVENIVDPQLARIYYLYVLFNKTLNNTHGPFRCPVYYHKDFAQSFPI